MLLQQTLRIILYRKLWFFLFTTQSYGILQWIYNEKLRKTIITLLKIREYYGGIFRTRKKFLEKIFCRAHDISSRAHDLYTVIIFTENNRFITFDIRLLRMLFFLSLLLSWCLQLTEGGDIYYIRINVHLYGCLICKEFDEDDAQTFIPEIAKWQLFRAHDILPRAHETICYSHEIISRAHNINSSTKKITCSKYTTVEYTGKMWLLFTMEKLWYLLKLLNNNQL